MTEQATRRLLVSLEARTAQFERALQRAERQNRQQLARMQREGQRQLGAYQRAWAQTGTVVQTQMATMARSFAAGALGGVGAAALIRRARSIVAEVSEIGKLADRIGLTTEELQRLRHAFKLAGVEQGQFDQGMQAFAQRLGEAATRGGRLADLLEANNVALRDAEGNMRPVNDLLRDFARLVENAGSEQEQLTIATMAFGDRAGRVFVNALRDLNGVGAEAAASADVIRDDLVRAAEEFDDRIEIAWHNFGNRAKSALLEAMQWMDRVQEHPLWSQLGGLFELQRLLSGQGGSVAGALFGPLARPGEGDQAIQAQQRQVERLRQMRDNAADLGFEAGETARELEEAERQLDRLIRTYTSGLHGVTPPTATPEGTPARTIITPDDDDSGNRRASSRNHAAAAAMREMQAVLDLIDSLEHELSLVGKSQVEIDKANAIRAAGAAATEEQKARIGELIEAIDAEREALQRTEEAARFFEGAMMSAFDAMIPRIDTGNSALDNFLNTLIRVVAQAALLGKGPLAGLFNPAGSTGGEFFSLNVR